MGTAAPSPTMGKGVCFLWPALGPVEGSWNWKGSHQEQAGGAGVGMEAGCQGLSVRATAVSRRVCRWGQECSSEGLQWTPESSHKRQAFGHWSHTEGTKARLQLFQSPKTFSTLCVSPLPVSTLGELELTGSGRNGGKRTRWKNEKPTRTPFPGFRFLCLSQDWSRGCGKGLNCRRLKLWCETGLNLSIPGKWDYSLITESDYIFKV